MRTTARDFAAELEQAGCRITWDDFWTDSEFAASIGRGRTGRQLWVVFYKDDDGPFWYAQVGRPERYMGGMRLRSMKAVREYLGIEVAA